MVVQGIPLSVSLCLALRVAEVREATSLVFILRELSMGWGGWCERESLCIWDNKVHWAQGGPQQLDAYSLWALVNEGVVLRKETFWSVLQGS